MTTPNPFDSGLFWCEGCQTFDQLRYLDEHDVCFEDNDNQELEGDNDNTTKINRTDRS